MGIFGSPIRYFSNAIGNKREPVFTQEELFSFDVIGNSRLASASALQ
jgi:hypothetical protein